MATATQSLSAFLPYVLPHALGCPDFIALNELRGAAIRFCQETLIWKHDILFIQSDKRITLPAPAGSKIIRVDEVKVNSATASLKLVDADDPLAKAELFGVTTRIGATPEFAVITDVDEIAIVPYNDADNTILMARCRLKPTFGVSLGANLIDASNVVPAFLLTDYAETIAAGALSRILLLPGHSFTNPQAAPVFDAIYQDGTNRAQGVAAKTQVNSPRRVPKHWL